MLEYYVRLTNSSKNPCICLGVFSMSDRNLKEGRVQKGWLSIPGQSVRGEVNSPTTCSNVPAHASLCVKKLEERLNIFLMVAGIEECSNSELGVGPFGPPTTANTNTTL